MTIALWQIASGLGVGAFMAALFFRVIKHFGRAKGQGFQTSQLGKQATGIIAVLIIITFGVITVVGLVFYAPHSGASSAATPPKRGAVDCPSISPVSAARSWLTFLDDSDYDGSWDRSSVRLQESMDKFNWKKALTEFRHPLGAPTDRTVVNVKPWKKIDEHTYFSQVDFKTHFETDRERFEEVELSAIDGASPRVSSYRIVTPVDWRNNSTIFDSR